ncbi:MAG: TIM barrel protein [Bacteroidales bacterium]
MKTTRRTFIRTSAMAVAGAMVLGQAACNSAKKPKKGKLGLQLYSVRDDMEKDPAGSLKLVKAQGWEYVEHANYVDGKFYGYAPTDFRKLLDDTGLKMISGHTVLAKDHWDDTAKDFTDVWKKLVDDAAVLGQKYVVSPWMDPVMYASYEEFMKTLDIYNKCGDLCNKKGMKFGYHNHDFEFKVILNEKKLFDIFMTTIDPSKVVMQLDTGNLYNGGAVALDVVKQYPGRWEFLHVKDEIKTTTGEGESYESTIVGEGIANVKEVIDLATELGGVEVYIVEQESYQGKTPMDAVKADFEIMKKWGY